MPEALFAPLPERDLFTGLDPNTPIAPQQSTQYRGLEIEKHEDGSLKLFDFQDVLLAPARGVEGLVRSIGDLANVLPGVDIDLSSDRYLGRSKSLAGGLVEVVTQFAIPFGATSKALSLISKGLTISRAGVAASLAQRAGLLGSTVLRNTLSGVGADVLAFGGHEERLSNLIQQVPGLRNPVSEFLAARPDDSEALGRFKNVLEGLALGGAIDTLVGGVRAIKNYRTALAEGASVKEAAEILAKTGPAPEEVAKALEASPALQETAQKSEPLAASLFEEGEIKEATSALDPPPPTPKQRVKATEEELKAGNDRYQKLVREARKRRNRREVANKQFLKLDEAVEGFRSPDVFKNQFRQIFKEAPEQVAVAISEFDRLTKVSPALKALLGKNLNKVPKEVKALLGFHSSRKFLNLTYTTGSDEVNAVIQSLGNVLSQTIFKQAEPDAILEALPYVADLTNSDTLTVANKAAAHLESVASAQGFMTAATIVQQSEAAAFADDVVRLLDTGEGLVQAENRLARLAIIGYSQGALGEGFGRGLRARKIVVGKELLDIGGTVLTKAREGQLESLIGKKEIRRRLNQLATLSRLEPDEQASLAARWAGMDFLERGIAVSNEVVITNLLSGLKTATTTALFPLAHGLYVPLEHILGGTLTAGVGALTRNQGIRDAGLHLVRRELASIFAGVKGLADAVRFRKFGESFQYAGKVAKDEFLSQARGTGRSGGPIITQAGRAELPETSILSSKYLLPGGADNRFAPIFDKLLAVYKFPVTLIKSADELTRQLSARTYIFGESFANAIDNGLDRASAIAHAEDNLDKAFLNGQLLTEQGLVRKAQEAVEASGFKTAPDETGAQAYSRAIKEKVKELRDAHNFHELSPITDAALARAGEIAATTPQPEGSVFGSVSKFVQEHPFFRILLPFTNTPANFARFVGQRQPLDAFGSVGEWFLRSNFGKRSPAIEELRLRNAKEFFGGDNVKKAEVIGRLFTGTTVLSGALLAANGGVITGGGPRDRSARQLLLATGWQPYSIKTENGYVQYSRVDPVSTLVSLSADLVDLAKFNRGGPDADDAITTAASALIMSIGRNIASKTYLTGLQSAIEAFTQGDRSAANWVQSLVPAAVIPRVVQSVRSVTDDPVLRDARSIIDELAERTPWLSSRIPPQRNLFGEPIVQSLGLGADPDTVASLWLDLFVPVTYREVKDDVVNTELRTLAHGFNPPPETRLGITLRDYESRGQDAHDRWSQLHGSVRLRGKTLQEALRDLISSSKYKSLPDDPALFDRRPKVAAISSLIQEYREEAWTQTLREYPLLARDVKTLLRQRERAVGQGNSDNPFARLGQ